MHLLTTVDLESAIEVLEKLAERINLRAEQYAIQFAEATAGAVDVGRIHLRAIEDTTRIERVVAQIDQWRREINQETGHHVSDHQ